MTESNEFPPKFYLNMNAFNISLSIEFTQLKKFDNTSQIYISNNGTTTQQDFMNALVCLYYCFYTN